MCTYEKHDELVRLVRETAGLLGMTAEPAENCWYGYTITDGTVWLRIEPGRQKGSVHVRGVFPYVTSYRSQEGERDGINVAVRRGAQALAGETRRRLLPKVQEVTAAVTARDAEDAAAEAERRAFAERIRVACPPGTVLPQPYIKPSKPDDIPTELIVDVGGDGLDASTRVTLYGVTAAGIYPGRVRMGAMTEATLMRVLAALRTPTGAADVPDMGPLAAQWREEADRRDAQASEVNDSRASLALIREADTLRACATDLERVFARVSEAADAAR